MEDVRVTAAGDDGLLIEIKGVPVGHLHALALILRGRPDVRACIVAHSSLLLIGGSPEGIDGLSESIEFAAEAAEALAEEVREESVIEIGVDFSDEYAPDLARLVEASGRAREEVIKRLTETVFRARYLGFLPGFAYLEGLPDEFALPRLDRPRLNVPAGTFAVAGNMAGFYSEDSPGGWNLLGRTDVRLWNPRKDPPNSIAPGDDLRIVDATGHLDIRSFRRSEPVCVGRETAEVLQPGQMTRVVGPTDFDCYAYGIAAGGPFDPEMAALANQVVGNPPDAAVLECAAVGPGLRFLRSAKVVAYGASVSPLVNGHRTSQHGIEVEEGDLLTFGRIRDGFRVVIAIDGGIEDSRAHYAPRPIRLRKGDVVHTSETTPERRSIRALRRDDHRSIGAMAGPHEIDEEMLSLVFSSAWVVTPALNRLGIRLRPDSRPIQPPADLESCGMRFGSVQWHPGGDLVLLGPDHPVTGGYLQPITVVSSDLWKLGQLAPGDRVHFVRS